MENARRLAAEEMVTLLAHDLSHTLTPIKGRLDILRRRFTREGREQDLKDVTEGLRGMERLQRMVADLLDVARLDQGLFALSPQTVDLVALVEAVVMDFRPLHPEIAVRLPDELQIEIDARRITQALQNLVMNAIQHSRDRVPLSIGAGVERREDGNWVVVSVHDEGPGIPTEILPRLFTRFAAGPGSDGLGLGLYLARSIAEAHGGTLLADSADGTGTSFWLSLPLVRSESRVQT
jgi:signal transduction histidine kinase